MTRKILAILLILIAPQVSQAQFLDSFDKGKIEGWKAIPGDGTPGVELIQRDGYASMFVDGTKDKYNVYWTIIKQNIARHLDLKKLKDPRYELRVEAKVRIHNAPHRVNFMVNTQRTTDYHHDLMEFDLPDTNWHVISMTTRDLDAVPGDSVFVQFAATDFGLGKYYVDIDYYRADIINIKTAGPDKGPSVPYHPTIPEVNTFTNHLDVAHDALINSHFPEVNFNDWQVKEKEGNVRLLTVNENQWAVLRFDLEKYKNTKATGAGLLEITTYSAPLGGDYIKPFGEDLGVEFGKVRIIEILGGDPNWSQEKVTFNSITQGKKYEEVFNTQMMYDTEVTQERGGKTYITVSRHVLQRLFDGKTKGFLIRPLGAIDASFYSSENQKDSAPKLHF